MTFFQNFLGINRENKLGENQEKLGKIWENKFRRKLGKIRKNLGE